MIRRLFLGALAALALGSPAGAATQIVVTSGISWTVPDDWNDVENTVELIGGGAHGGGAYAKKTNVALTRGAAVTIQIGTGGSVAGTGGDTCFSSCVFLKAAGASGATGGQAASSVGTITYSGGNGGGGASDAGGGAAGPHGAGGNGNSTTGGTGDAGFGGAGGVGGVGLGNGANGTEWTSAGSGGGGGGGTTCTCNGGLYGAGSINDSFRTGRDGVIVIIYTPHRRVSQGAF